MDGGHFGARPADRDDRGVRERPGDRRGIRRIRHPPHRRLAAAGVLAQCHRAGIKTMVWTVDEDAEIRRWLTDRRVTVLITNRPADAVALRASLPQVRPAASPGQ